MCVCVCVCVCVMYKYGLKGFLLVLVTRFMFIH